MLVQIDRAVFIAIHWLKRAHVADASLDSAGTWMCLICDLGTPTPEMAPCLSL